VPTHAETDQFKRDLEALSPDDRRALKRAVRKFVEGLRSKKFRKGLRVNGIQGASGIFEMTWAGDGRATFQYGREVIEGEPHVIWRRVGDHSIFRNP
jgi:hypothetical protein